jgi:hypothetical protein
LAELVNTWWRLRDLVDWFRKIDPNASTIRILSAVEERCACGQIRARGRRRVYVWDRLPKISHTDPGFVPMSEEYSQASPTLEEIPRTEWRDLVFFGRPVVKAGEEYLLAFAQAFDNLASPLELRSNSKYRLAWLDVEIFGDDVVREFSPAEGEAQRDAAKPELQSGVSARLGSVTAGLGSSIRRLAPVSDRDFRSWYQKRVSEFMARDETSSGEHDWIAAKQAFGGRVTRARVREMREKMAPDHWGKQGRRPASRGQ